MEFIKFKNSIVKKILLLYNIKKFILTNLCNISYNEFWVLIYLYSLHLTIFVKCLSLNDVLLTNKIIF